MPPPLCRALSLSKDNRHGSRQTIAECLSALQAEPLARCKAANHTNQNKIIQISFGTQASVPAI